MGVTHQNKMRRTLATSRMKQTSVEKPSVERDLTMALYCGMYGTTPPKMMADEATAETKLPNHSIRIGWA